MSFIPAPFISMSCKTDIEQRLIPTTTLDVAAPVTNQDMVRLCDDLDRAIKELLGDGAHEIKIRWNNILSADDNPNGNLGHILAIGYRKTRHE